MGLRDVLEFGLDMAKVILKGAPGFLATPFVHESGHYLAARVLGGNPRINISFKPLQFNTSPNIPNYTMLKDAIIGAGGPTLEYLAAYSLAFLGNKIDEIRHQTLREIVKLSSVALSLGPPIYALGDFIVKGGGDYMALDDLGVPFFITLPATLLATGLNIYYNLRK